MWRRGSKPTIPQDAIYQRQLHRMGCGIAALAMVLEKTYPEVHSSFGPKKDFDRKGMRIEELCDHLFDRGFAIVVRTRARPPGGVWPVQPWADKHVLLVRKWWWQQLHFAVLLKDGRVLDPHYGQVDMSFYRCVYAIIGVHKVRGRAA